MLTIDHLTKTYGDKKAVDDLTLHIAPGEIYGFIGHNGAGKTTTLKACAGILPYDAGEIRVAGGLYVEDLVSTVSDVTVSGTRELTEEEWASFFACLSGGTVRARSESADAGGSGPWLYLYWKGDRGKYQEFSFASWGAQRSFEELCRTMRDS